MIRIFASLFFATATAQLGLGIISPILPLYASAFAASAVQLGLVFTAFSVSRAVFAPFVGRLSDRIGRRTLIVGGLAIYACVSVLYVSADRLWLLGVFRFLQGIGSVMVTPIAQAYVGDLTPRGKEGRTLNAFYSSQFIGMAFGPLLGGMIGGFWSYDAAFCVMGGLSVLSLLLVVLTVPVDPVTRTRRTAVPKAIVPMRKVLGNDAVKAMMIYFMTRGFWRQSFTAFYPLFAVASFAAGEASIGLVLSTYMLAEGLLQVPFGFLADRYPRIRQIVVGSVFAPLVLLAVPFLQSSVSMAVLTFAMGAFSALGRASLVAMRTEIGRTHGMATLAGLQGSAFAVGQALGPVVSGVIIDTLSLVFVFPFGSAVGCVGTAMVLRWLRRWLRNDTDAAAMARQPLPS